MDMGVSLAEKIKRELPVDDIDVVMPIPDTSRPSAMELAVHLENHIAKVLIKNRYIGRTFIMPGQATRKNQYAKNSVRWKPGLTAKAFCWWMIPLCAVRPAVKSLKWYARRQVHAKSTLLPAAPEVRYPECVRYRYADP